MVHVIGLSFDPIGEARKNWQKHGWPAADAMVAATSITRAHQILLGRIDTALAPFGLNFSRFEAITLLRFTRAGELPLGKMGERLQVHPASITNTIDRLERDGLVSRLPHPSDGRTTLARLTKQGRSVVDQAQRALAGIDFGLDGLTEQQFNRITADIVHLRQQAGDWSA